jgi:hypothetical protein
MKSLNVIRKFERFNFHGVPESPEPSYDRNYNAQYIERQTGRSLSTLNSNLDLSQFPIIGYIIDDPDTHEEIFVEKIEDLSK